MGGVVAGGWGTPQQVMEMSLERPAKIIDEQVGQLLGRLGSKMEEASLRSLEDQGPGPWAG